MFLTVTTMLFDTGRHYSQSQEVQNGGHRTRSRQVVEINKRIDEPATEKAPPLKQNKLTGKIHDQRQQESLKTYLRRGCLCCLGATQVLLQSELESLERLHVTFVLVDCQSALRRS